MFKSCYFAFAALAVLAVAGHATAATVLIDDFNDTQFVTTGPPTAVLYSGMNGLPDVFGGSRMILSPNGTTQTGQADANISVASRFTFSTTTQPPPNPTVFTLIYDGNAEATQTPINTTGIASTDITSGGTNTGFLTLLSDSTNDGIDLEMTVWLLATNSSVATLHAMPTAGDQFFFLPFASFVGTADFTDITAMEVDTTTTSSQGGTGEIHFIEAGNNVPEPSSAIVFGGLALAGFFGFRVWKRRG